VKAQTEIADFNAHFGTQFPTTSSTPSAASCCARSAPAEARRGRRRSTTIRFRVLRADSRRLHTLQVEKVAAATTTKEGST
jgi:magnesium and cobalt transporter